MLLLSILWSPVPGQETDVPPDERAKTVSDSGPDDWATIQALLNQQVRAWNAGDIDGFMQTYWHSPELTFSGGGKTTRGWQATHDRYKARYPDKATMGTLSFSDLEYRCLGRDVALVLGQWHLETRKGNPHGNFSLVLQRLDGKWLIVHDHSSTLETDEPDDPPNDEQDD